MKGQIRKRGNTYSVIVPLGKDASGKKRYKWVTCRTKREAEAKRAELINQVNNGEITSPKGTFGDFAARWLAEYAVPNLSPRTVEEYKSIVKARMGPALRSIPLKSVRPELIQKYYADMLAAGLCTTTVRHHAMLLHRILEHAVRWQLLTRNPAEVVTPPAVRRTEMHTLTADQSDVVLREAERTAYWALFHVALFTGMRQSELLALRWQDVDLAMAEIRISRTMHRLLTHEVVFRTTKTATSRRTIALSPSTCDVLRLHLDKELSQCVRLGVYFTSDRLVFCKWSGEPLLPRSVSQAWGRLTARLGIVNVRFHDLRHTCATLLLTAGIHPKVVQERLGHATISTTLDLYSHVTPNMQRQAAAALDALIRKE